MRPCTTRGYLLCFTVAIGIVTAGAPAAEARPRPAGKHKAFKANKTFGLGFMLGAPTGLSGKYFLSADTALDFGLGTIYRYRDREGVHAHLDFLWHPFSLASAQAFELPLYFGVGGRILYGDRCYSYNNRGVCDYYFHNYTAMGPRGSLGLAFDFNKVPLDIFFEIALVLDFVIDRDNRYDDSLYLDFNGAVGLRYYFN